MTSAAPAKANTTYPTAEAAIAAAARMAGGTLVAVWSYPGDGFRVVRFDLGSGRKSYRPVHHNGDGWVLGDPPGLLPLYNSDKIPAVGPVAVVEGELCVTVAGNVGLPAVTSAHGALSASKSDWQRLAGREVIVLPDNDDIGRKYASEVSTILNTLTPPAKVKIVTLPGLGEGEDIADWVGPDGPMDCKTPEEIKAAVLSLAAAAKVWTPATEQAADEQEQFPLTDIGNAARFVAKAGNNFLYCGPWGKWLRWDGVRWCPDESLQVTKSAKAVALSIFDEIKVADSEDRQKALAKWAIASQRRERLAAMVDLSRCELAVSPTGLDKDGWLFNAVNGTIDLHTGQLRPHCRQDHLSKLAPVLFDASATCPLWEKVLHRIMAGNTKLISYLQRIAGMCLSDDVTEQVLFLLYGTGANGKSVFLDTQTGLMGDYATEAAPDLLIEHKMARHPTEIADLCGRRLVVAAETEEGGRLRVQLIKRFTGNARLKGRYMKQDFFEFPRTHKLIVATNNKPVIRESTLAIKRRLRLVPFSVVIPEQEQDKLLLEKLKAEWPGILNWAIQGCLNWQTDGLQTPEEVELATQAYQDEQDPLMEFLQEQCILTATAFVPRTELYKAYQLWADHTHERYPLERGGLYERVRNKAGVSDGQQRIGGRPTKGFVGIGLLTPLDRELPDA